MRRNGDEAPHLLLIPFAPGIGDMVIMEPLLRAVRAALPEWRLTMVARDYTADLLPVDGYDLVSPAYFMNRTPPPLRPLHRLIPQAVVARAAEYAMALDLGPFEQVINLFWVWESTTPFESWWTPEWPLQEGVRHTLDILADYLEGELGMEIPSADRLPRLPVFPEAMEWAKSYLPVRGGRRPTASLVVSADNALKWWAVPKWVELNERLVRMGWRTVMVAPHGHSHAREVFDACVHKPLWPEMGLRRVAAVLARSDVVVGIDTGPLHMAAALGMPWVGLFGPTNPFVIGPYDTSVGRPVVAPFAKPPSCEDCWLSFKNREDRCPTLAATGCTTLIPVEEVLEAIFTLRGGTTLANPADPGHAIDDD